MFDKGCPAMTISPAVGVSMPAAIASQVDLPAPELPRKSSVPPWGTSTSSKEMTGPRG
jgi:hypothetical protein